MNKVYEIAGVKFILKTDLELDESIEISNILKNLYAEPGDSDRMNSPAITGRFSAEEMKRFLSLVLEPVPSTGSGTGKRMAAESVAASKSFAAAEPVEAAFFGRTKESVQIEVFKDFFLDRIRKANSLAEDFADSILQQRKS